MTENLLNDYLLNEVTMKVIKILPALLLFSLLGCATTPLDNFKQSGLSRAAFDLKCPESSLRIKQINGSTSYLGTSPVGTVGVEGCGKSAVYVNSVAGWILNSKVSNQ